MLPALPGLFLEEPFFLSLGFEGVCAADFGPGLAANTSSIPELVGEFASLIPAKDTKAQIESIKNVIQKYDYYKDIAEKGREHIITKFNWLKITEEYEKTIFKTIENFKNADV